MGEFLVVGTGQVDDAFDQGDQRRNPGPEKHQVQEAEAGFPAIKLVGAKAAQEEGQQDGRYSTARIRRMAVLSG